MYINFTPHKANVNNSNASSCANIFEYLEKEKQGFVQDKSVFKDENKESIGFFDQPNINIPKDPVIENIDNNRGKRGIKESNFYMINISPSYLEKEEQGFVQDKSVFKDDNKESIGFFDQQNMNIPKVTMIESIDNNTGIRGIKESNFYMINISPFYLEQKHLLKRIDQFLEDK